MLLEFLMQHFSYGVLFVWSVFEGEIGLALAGYKVQMGQFDPFYAVSIAVAGALIGDMSVFLAGKFFKNKTELLLRQHEKRLLRIEEWFRYYGSWIIIFERFVYGTHIPALLMVGVSGYGFVKFLILDIIGVVLWAVTFTALGYYFGQTVIDILSIIQRHLTIILIIALFGFAVYQLHLMNDE